MVNYDEVLKEASKKIKEQEKLIQCVPNDTKKIKRRLLDREKLEGSTHGIIILFIEIIIENFPNTR